MLRSALFFRNLWSAKFNEEHSESGHCLLELNLFLHIQTHIHTL